MSTGPVLKHQPEESQQKPCSYQETFIKPEGKEVEEEIYFKLGEEVEEEVLRRRGRLMRK